MRGLVLGGLLGLPHTKISLGGKNRSFFINRDSTLECKNVQLRGKSHSRLSVSKLMYIAEKSADWVPVSLLLDESTVTSQNTLMDPEGLKQGLKALQDSGVTHIMVHVWWGVVENKPGVYDWTAYQTLFRMIRDMGFQIQAFLCFHGNGDVTLPSWILEEGSKNPDIFYTDRQGKKCHACLSLGVDSVPALQGRTGGQAYEDFMSAFVMEFRNLLGICIQEVVVGLGPQGELKYPSHPLKDQWSFPGIGEFQCYDSYMRSTVQACAEQSGHWDWGIEGGPHNAGDYRSTPQDTDFFSMNGGWRKPYGKFFLQWYATMLLRHGYSILNEAVKVFSQYHVTVGAKVPMVHWWYNTPSHAAELTAGIYNTEDRDGYLPTVSMLADLGASLHVAGADTLNSKQPSEANCNPETLHAQIRACAAAFQVPIGVQNTGSMKDDSSWDRLLQVVLDESRYRSINLPLVSAVTLTSLHDDILDPSFHKNLKRFVSEVNGVCGDDWEDLSQVAHVDGLGISHSCGKQYQANPCSVT